MDKYRGGDVVLVKVTIGKDPRRPGQVIKGQGWFSNRFVDVYEEDIVELVVRKFRKGDNVIWGTDYVCTGTIIYIHEGKAWIESDSMHTVSIADLTLAPPKVTAKLTDIPNDHQTIKAEEYLCVLEGGGWLRPKGWVAGYIAVDSRARLKVNPPHDVKTIGGRRDLTLDNVIALMNAHGDEWENLDEDDVDD